MTLTVFAAVGVCAVPAGGYWFLANRGLLRWLALILVIAAPVLILVAFAWHHLVWVAIVAVALMPCAAAVARIALRTDGGDAGMLAAQAGRPQHPFLIMNPRSGGGKVAKFGLKEKAEALGAEVAVLDGPGNVDVAALVREAVDRGADLLGVAGGDGTQALVAGIAADHDIPLLVISAGTRNHFALDLGLDREDPAACLEALTDGEEVRVDLGFIGDRTFVNNASFGAYAEIVQSPEYRDNKNRTTLEMLPDLLGGQQGADLTVRTAGDHGRSLQAVLVSNNPYGSGRGWPGPARPARPGHPGCDRRPDGQHRPGRRTAPPGAVTAASPGSPPQRGHRRRRRAARFRWASTARRSSAHPRALHHPAPRAAGDRARHRPGVPPPSRPRIWPRLRQLASFRTQPDGQRAQPEAERSPQAR